MLSQTLQRLDADGLVTRSRYAIIPPRVDYDRTRLGRPIAERIGDLIRAIYEQLPGVVTHRRSISLPLAAAPASPNLSAA